MFCNRTADWLSLQISPYSSSKIITQSLPSVCTVTLSQALLSLLLCADQHGDLEELSLSHIDHLFIDLLLSYVHMAPRQQCGSGSGVAVIGGLLLTQKQAHFSVFVLEFSTDYPAALSQFRLLLFPRICGRGAGGSCCRLTLPHNPQLWTRNPQGSLKNTHWQNLLTISLWKSDFAFELWFKWIIVKSKLIKLMKLAWTKMMVAPEKTTGTN